MTRTFLKETVKGIKNTKKRGFLKGTLGTLANLPLTLPKALNKAAKTTLKKEVARRLEGQLTNKLGSIFD